MLYELLKTEWNDALYALTDYLDIEKHLDHGSSTNYAEINTGITYAVNNIGGLL